MRHLSIRRDAISDISPLALLLPPLAATALLWLTSPHESETAAVVASFILLLLPWGSFLVWRDGNRQGLPIFAMIGGAYWIFFGVALLWVPRQVYLAGSFSTFLPSEDMVTATMFLTVAGVVALRLGMHVPVSVWVPARLPDIVDTPRSWNYVRGVLLVGIGLNLVPGAAYLLGAGGRQAMTTFSSVVPNVAFVLLLLRYMNGRATRTDKAALLGAAGMFAIIGLASGWLGAVASIGVLYGAVTVLHRRRIPWMAVGIATVVVLFLQVGKNQFRNVYWAEGADASVSERISFWLGESASEWDNAIQGEAGSSVQRLASQTLQRLSLLPQVAHVVELTPSQVPFQDGASYKYLAVTLIPRFVWPDKPSISEANRFYQVAYGLTKESGLDTVSIAVGALGEAYMNFGWSGGIAIMFGIGVVLGLYDRTFALMRSSSLFLAIGVALIPGFLTIESQLGQYFGGVLQQALFAAAVFFPITKRRVFITPGFAPASRAFRIEKTPV